MKSFWAIVKLTYRNAIRSHIFQLLLLVLLLCVALVPTTVRGSVNAADFLQISIFYSLSAISFVLSLSSIWIGCFVMTQDVEGYQLHMVVTKPVSRIKIWFAKWTGVCLIHLLLLFLASLATYFIILWNFDKQDYPQSELDKVRAEVMVGRRVFKPERPDYDAMAREMIKQRIDQLRREGRDVDTSPEAQDRMLAEKRREIMSRSTELPFNNWRNWKFTNLPEKLERPMFLRYRPYVGKVSSKDQRMTRGLWFVGVPKMKKDSNGNVFQTTDKDKSASYEVFLYPLAAAPEQVMSGVFHEKKLDSKWGVITPDNEVHFRYLNADDQQGAQFFQEADGPKLLVEVTGFGANYARAVLVIALGVIMLAGLGCAFGGFMSMPTAVFVVISYLLFGSLAVYILNQSYVSGVGDQMARLIANVLLKVVIPLQVFDVTGLVSHGELVEFAYVGRILYYYFPRALVLFALGIFMYRRRELGLIIRK